MRIGVSALAMTDEQSAARAGIARYAFALLDALGRVNEKHEFVVAHGTWFTPPAEWTARRGWTFEVARGTFRKTKTLWDSFSARAFIERHKPDVWLSTAHALPVFTRIPCVLTVHDLLVFQYPEHFSLRHRLVIGGALRRSIRRADRLLAVSEHTANEIVRYFGVPREKITVTPLGPGNVVKRRESATVSEGELRDIGLPWLRYLFTLGTLEPRKNLKRLIFAFARIAEAPEGQGLGLAIAGGSGWMTSDLARTVEKLGLKDRVAFLGYVPDEKLPALFARCEAFVFPSIAEGFGLPVLEAMALGAPVACSARSSIPEVGGDAAEYFDPTKPEAIANAVLSILRTPEKRRARIERGLIQAEKFSWERCARLTLETLERPFPR